jgi:hypothetical protein
MDAQKFSCMQLPLDDPTQGPFISRVLAGLTELRDTCLASHYDSHWEVFRDRYDAGFMQMFNALLDARRAMTGVARAIRDHEAKLASGTVVRFSSHGHAVTEDINDSLRGYTCRLIRAAANALYSVQSPLAVLWVEFRPLYFARDANFRKKLATPWALKHLGQNPSLLTDYLVQVRQSWSKALISRSDAIGKGWTLPEASYDVVVGGKVELIEPQIDGVGVRQYTEKTFNRVATFAENVIAYGLKSCLKPPFAIFEIPRAERSPDHPKRFRVGIAERGEPEWVLTYRESEF